MAIRRPRETIYTWPTLHWNHRSDVGSPGLAKIVNPNTVCNCATVCKKKRKKRKAVTYFICNFSSTMLATLYGITNHVSKYSCSSAIDRSVCSALRYHSIRRSAWRRSMICTPPLVRPQITAFPIVCEHKCHSTCRKEDGCIKKENY